MLMRLSLLIAAGLLAIGVGLAYWTITPPAPNVVSQLELQPPTSPKHGDSAPAILQLAPIPERKVVQKPESPTPAPPEVAIRTPEDSWSAKYQNLDRSALSARANELQRELTQRVDGEIKLSLASGKYQILPMNASIPAASDDVIGSGSTMIEGGDVPILHYVAIRGSEYPDLAVAKKELDWLNAQMRTR